MKSSNPLPDYECPHCKTRFKPRRKASRFCSRSCMWANNGGHNKKTESWWKNSRGYIEGRIWNADGSQSRIKQHRLVIQGIIGRALLPSEDVHHINGIKHDNRPENLRLISHGEHAALSNNTRPRRKGYKMNLTDSQRKSRSERAKAMNLYKLGQAAILKSSTLNP